MPLIPFDQRDGYVWFDGRMLANTNATIHWLTHGLHYGSAVFEGLRAYGGRIFKLDEHVERLLASANYLDMQPAVGRDEMAQACRDVLAQSGLGDAYIRPLLWRGAEQMGVGGALTRIHAAVAVWEWQHSFNEDAIRNGITMTVSPWRRPPPACAPHQAKASGLYVTSTLSKRHAEQHGMHDALMLDWRGQVSEASAANIFLVIDGVLHTPEPDCFLNGITRQTIIALARAQGLTVVERAVQPDELARAQEVFLTGTAYEIMPVARIDDHHFQPGAITARLQRAYHDLVHAP